MGVAVQSHWFSVGSVVTWADILMLVTAPIGLEFFICLSYLPGYAVWNRPLHH